ncbi:MAG: hypothetical protein JJT78_08280 [Leptospira sp.]|nr:hypothetical protein [Leptospira sp.]
MKKIGITGSRKGLNDKQRLALLESLKGLGNVEIHHGDCVGVDCDIHKLLVSEKENLPEGVKVLQISIHPPSDKKQRAFCEKNYPGLDILIHSYSTEEYLKRNQFIVNLTDELWAFPDGPEKQRSGTWSTIRNAKKSGKPVKIFEP